MKLFSKTWALRALLISALPFLAWRSAPAQVYTVKAGDILAANYRAAGSKVVSIDPLTQRQQLLGTFDVPTDLVMAPDGNLYISEWGGTIKRLNLANGGITLVNTNSTLSQVWGITRSADGDLFVTSGSSSSNRIVRINPVSGVETEVASGGQMSPPIGIEFLDPAHLVVASLLNSRVLSVALVNGAQTSLGGGGFDQPWGIAVHGTNVYVGAHDSKLLQRISGTNTTDLASLADFPYGIATETNGNIVVATSGGVSGPYAVVRFDPAGNQLNYYSGGWIGEITGLDVAPVGVLAANQINTPPVATHYDPLEANEGVLLTFTPLVTDPDWPFQTLTYALENPVPAGATISTNGLFTWKPGEDQGPSTNVVTFRVSDDGIPSLSITQSFTVIVHEVNTAPAVIPPGTRTAIIGTTLAFNISATDTDLPPQTLTFNLEADAPAGATLSAGGAFSWSPSVDQPQGDYSVGVVVTDNGNPPLTDTNRFIIQVREVNVSPMFDNLTNRTVNENTLLSFQLTATDSNQPPQTLTYGLAASAPSGVAVSSSGLFTWTPTEAQGPITTNIALRVTDNGVPPLSSTGSVMVVVNEVNRTPTLTAIPNQLIYLGQSLAFTASGQDPDLPAQVLTYSLQPGAPAGATISPAGVFNWWPAVGQAPSTNSITVTVTDDGIPPLNASRTLVAEVRGGFVLNPGDLVVADYAANSVVKIDGQTGVYQLLGSFTSPTDVALSTNGGVYVSEQGGSIKRLDLQTGIISTVNPGSILSNVRALALSPTGDLYVAAAGNNSIVRITAATGLTTPVTQGGLISGPYGLALLDTNHLVVSSFFNDSLVVVALTNNSQYLAAQTNGISQPWGVAATAGLPSIAGYGAHAVQTLPNGVVTNLITLTDRPVGIAAATNGDLFVSVYNGATSKIASFSSGGVPLTEYTAGLTGLCMGVEVAVFQTGGEKPPTLQRSDTPGGPYVDDVGALVDPVGKTITAPQHGSTSFYRLRSVGGTRITGIHLMNGQVTVSYE